MQPYLPLSRQDGLFVQNLDKEIVLLDTRTNQAQLLNPTAAAVWQRCDGQTTVPAIATRLTAELGMPVNETLVWYSLDLLTKKGLLIQDAARSANNRRMTRRDFLQAGLVGGAVVLPVILSLTAPTAAHAASDTCLQPGIC